MNLPVEPLQPPLPPLPARALLLPTAHSSLPRIGVAAVCRDPAAFSHARDPPCMRKALGTYRLPQPPAPAESTGRSALPPWPLQERGKVGFSTQMADGGHHDGAGVHDYGQPVPDCVGRQGCTALAAHTAGEGARLAPGNTQGPGHDTWGHSCAQPSGDMAFRRQKRGERFEQTDGWTFCGVLRSIFRHLCTTGSAPGMEQSRSLCSCKAALQAMGPARGL